MINQDEKWNERYIVRDNQSKSQAYKDLFLNLGIHPNSVNSKSRMSRHPPAKFEGSMDTSRCVVCKETAAWKKIKLCRKHGFSSELCKVEVVILGVEGGGWNQSRCAVQLLHWSCREHEAPLKCVDARSDEKKFCSWGQFLLFQNTSWRLGWKNDVAAKLPVNQQAIEQKKEKEMCSKWKSCHLELTYVGI